MNIGTSARSLIELSENLEKNCGSGMEELYRLHPELRPVIDEAKSDWNEAEHPRADDGKFGSGASSSAKPRALRIPEEKPGAAVQKLRDAHLVVDATIQRYCEEHNERNVAHALGGASLPDSEPVDVKVPPRRPKHGIELKTMVTNKRGAIRMSRAARERKAAWESETGATLHTLVLDDRHVFNAKGEGKHDEAQRVIYYRRGCGNLSVGSMHKCKNMAEVRRLMAMSDDELPTAAKRLTPAQVKAWIEEGEEI